MISDQRAAANRANAQLSTGPVTPAGKERSSRNATTHGLTSQSAILPSEDPAAHQRHLQEFMDEYEPQGPTETSLVQQLANTSWRINRIPAVENHILGLSTHSGAVDVDEPDLETSLALTEALRRQERALDNLGRHGHRLHREFHKTLEQLREIQSDRVTHHQRQLKRAAGVLELHKHKGLPWNPADDGFVFSIEEIERHSQHLMRLNDAFPIQHYLFEAAKPLRPVANM